MPQTHRNIQSITNGGHYRYQTRNYPSKKGYRSNYRRKIKTPIKTADEGAAVSSTLAA